MCDDDYGNYIAWCREVGLSLSEEGADTLTLDSAQTAERAQWAALDTQEARHGREIPTWNDDEELPFEDLNEKDAD